jgi:hypothetical protein
MIAGSPMCCYTVLTASVHVGHQIGCRLKPAAEFLAFLESEFSDTSGYEIFGHLRRRKGIPSRTGMQVREAQEERERVERHRERQGSGKR